MNTRMKTILWLIIFSCAMGCLEGIVVVYLRELYYPTGFGFPMVELPPRIMVIELIREAATLVMLATVGIIAGDSLQKRFAGFLFCFAVWDIFYYVFLKLMLNWPESLLTWDILFLIPMVWTGPVLAPLTASFTMILLAILIQFNRFKVRRITFWLIASGTSLIFLSMVWDFARHMLSDNSFAQMFVLNISQKALTSYIPKSFPWWMFVAGEILIVYNFIGKINFHKITMHAT